MKSTYVTEWWDVECIPGAELDAYRLGTLGAAEEPDENAEKISFLNSYTGKQNEQQMKLKNLCNKCRSIPLPPQSA